MRKRLVGYAIAGGALLAVSAVSAYMAHAHRVGQNGRANLNFTLKDMNGAEVRLADFKGKPLVLNFWATWCGPCIVEQPELVELAAEYKARGLAIVGVSYNDDADEVKKYADEYKVLYPLLIGLDQDALMDAFGVDDGLPTSVFIRADGTIANRLVGINTKAWFQEQIQGLLDE